MLYIGMLIPVLMNNRKRVTLPMLGLPLAMKLVIFPLITAGLLLFLDMDQKLAHVALIQTAMPTIAMASILFARYAADEEMGAMTTVFSTLLGLLTIPTVIILGNLILQHAP